jgi:hypothetical protein
VPTPNLLEQTSHSDPFSSWDDTFGSEYTDSQRRSLVYKHSKEVIECLRRVTSGDAVKGKQLVELLSALEMFFVS